MELTIELTERGAVKATAIVGPVTLFAQSDSIHGALRNLAYEIQASQIEATQMALWVNEKNGK